jgi:hypothetical protein
MRHVRTTTYLRIPAAVPGLRRRCGACGRTGAQRLRERVARAAPVRVPVELAADCVPKAPSGVVFVIVTAVICRARDGRQAYARRLGLEPRIVCGAAVAVCAADLEGCTAIHTQPWGRLWHSSANTRGTAHVARPCGPCAAHRGRAAVPRRGLNVGAVASASGPAVVVAFKAAALSQHRAATPKCQRADVRDCMSQRACVTIPARVSVPCTSGARGGAGAPAHSCCALGCAAPVA